MSEIRADKLHNASGDNDSGIDLSTNDKVVIKTADTTALTVDSSQKIGMGVDPSTMPSFTTHCIKTTNGGGLSITSANAGDNRYIFFGNGTSSSDVQLAAIKNTNSGTSILGASGQTLVDIDAAGLMTIFDHTASANNQALSVSSKCTSRAGCQVTATNASFGNTNYGLLRLETVRSTSNAFQYAIMRSGDGADIQFQMRGDGNAFADNNWNAGGADYAEYFEWKDGNTDNEDRRGFTVVLDGNKIRKSTSDDAQSSIIGVVSAIPAVVGDSGQLGWQGKHERDEWGSYILEEYTQTEWTDADGKLKSYQTDKIPSDVTVPSDALVTSTEADGKTKLMRRKESSSYDASQTYIPREDRKEWDTIGLMGKLKVRVGQTVGDRWIKMREISDTVHEYLVR